MRAALAVVFLTACTSSSVPEAVSTSAAAPTCEDAVAPFGTDAESGESFPDLELTACDGTKVALRDLRCGAEATLVSVGAGWCGPCIDEAPELQALHETRGDQVQVVQVLFQDAAAKPATSLFCESWRDTHGLTMPVLIDPVGLTLDHFDQAQTPLNLLLDRAGRVLWSELGKPDDLEAAVLDHVQ